MLITAQNPSFRSFYSRSGQSPREDRSAHAGGPRVREGARIPRDAVPGKHRRGVLHRSERPRERALRSGTESHDRGSLARRDRFPVLRTHFRPQGRRGVPSDALCLTGHRRVGDLQLDAGAGHRLPRGRDRPLRSHRRIVSTHRSRDRETGRCGSRRREDRAGHPRQPLRAKAGPAARATVRHAIRGPRVLGRGQRQRHDRRASRRISAAFAGRPQCQRLVRGRAWIASPSGRLSGAQAGLIWEWRPRRSPCSSSPA